MSLNLGAPLDALVSMVAGISGVQAVYRGAPESMSNRVSAYVALGGHSIESDEFRELERQQRYLVVFGYRVQNAEATAEDTIADAVDAFEMAFFSARAAGTGLFATATTQVEDGALDVAGADSPEYAAYAGQEFRLYPLVVTVVQRMAD
jgi:hypothetical protein